MTQRLLRLFDTDGSALFVDSAHEPALDAHYARYLDSGRTRDQVMQFTAVGGTVVNMPLSHITGWMTGTPDEFAAFYEEHRRLRRAMNGGIDE